MLRRFMQAAAEMPERGCTVNGQREVMTDAEFAAGVNVKTAIDAHIRWKHRLEQYVQGTSKEQLAFEVVAADHQCVLGRWIHGDGMRKFGHFPIFQQLVEVHAEFHGHAGRILASAQQGAHEQAMNLLQTGEYPKTSAKVKRLLAKLYVDVLCEPAQATGSTRR